jgi:hypothetical protein
MEQGEPRSSSFYADEGTAAHFLSALCLTSGGNPEDFIDRTILVMEDGSCKFAGDPGETTQTGTSFEVEPMLEPVAEYLDLVRSIVMATGGDLFVEQQLSIEHLTGEAGATGTTDAVILAPPAIYTIDLKYGRGDPVSAEGNPQTRIYTLSAVKEFDILGDFTTAHMLISQPRLSATPSEEVMSIDDLIKWGDDVVKPAAFHALQVLYKEDPGAYIHHLNATEKACRWCRAKAKCPAASKLVRGAVLGDVTADFDDLTAVKTVVAEYDDLSLSEKMKACDMIEEWITAVRARVGTELLAGRGVPGYKLVQGRRGPRKWASPEEAEATLKQMRLKEAEMYDWTLISPTTAEKLAKAGTIGPRQWPKLQSIITQSEGKIHVAPESDKRPTHALPSCADEFDVVTPEQSVQDLV